MSKTQQKRITTAAAPLQRSHAVVAVSQKCQHFLKDRRRIVIAARPYVTMRELSRTNGNRRKYHLNYLHNTSLYRSLIQSNDQHCAYHKIETMTVV